MNFASYIVVLVVLGLVVLAIVALRKGNRSCCDGKTKKTGGKCASCSVDCPFKKVES